MMATKTFLVRDVGEEVPIGDLVDEKFPRDEQRKSSMHQAGAQKRFLTRCFAVGAIRWPSGWSVAVRGHGLEDPRRCGACNRLSPVSRVGPDCQTHPPYRIQAAWYQRPH